MSRCFTSPLRFGNQEGFANVKRAQVHSVGSSGMVRMACDIHENVPGFDEEAPSSAACMHFCLCQCVLGGTVGKMRAKNSKSEVCASSFFRMAGTCNKVVVNSKIVSDRRVSPELFGFPCRRDRDYP